MPRPRKQKYICALPETNTFGPAGASADSRDTIEMSIEEYETIRLIDHENLNQEQCAEIMRVARSTIQRLYTDARRKLADSIINGKTLKICGGDYTLCSQPTDQNICTGCRQHRGRHGRPMR